MKIPAIKGKIGSTVFYSSMMTFEDIAKYVKQPDGEFHDNSNLSDLIQRSITDNVGSIVEYIHNQEERFFNSLVLAVYNSPPPQWIEVEMQFPDEDTSYENMGFIQFSGEEKIFPVDGQHRVEAIKKAIQVNDELKNEKLSVVFIGHNTTPGEVEKTRRIFSTLNRYAKPISMFNIIALDEDDIIAISTRKLLENNTLLTENKISYTHNKSIPVANQNALTSIIALYEANRSLLQDYSPENFKGKSLKKFLKFRPSEDTIEDFYTYQNSYWNSFASELTIINNFLNHNLDDIRNSDNGGYLFFRPVGLVPFVEACAYIKYKTGDEYDIILRKFNSLNYILNSDLWNGIIWDNIAKKMLMCSRSFIRKLFIFLYSEDILTTSELNKLAKDYAEKKGIENPQREDILEMLRDYHVS